MNETLIMFDLSYDIFKESINEIVNILNNQEKNENNHNLYKLFVISYIKIYLNKLVYYIYNKKQYIGNIKDIIGSIIGTDKNNMFSKVLKIYIFKLFYNIMDKDLNTMKDYNFHNSEIDFTDIITDNIEIITEKNSPTDKKYKKYPLLKYFTYTEYNTREKFKNELGKDYMKEYPILYKYLSEENGDVKKLEFFDNFNDFCNYMIDYYSFNISRENAKVKNIENEAIFNDLQFKKNFDRFITSWNKIKNKCTKYKHYPEMEVKSLNKYDTLVYFLNDTNEVGNGMYIASAYQNFIKWQNQFLQSIIDIGKGKKYIDFYIEELKKTIPIYEASSNQALTLNSCFSNSDYTDFDELINIFTKRNIYNKNGTINYLEYNTFKYNISAIEEELAKIILTGKCLFEQDNLRLMKYLGEGFNDNFGILDKFYKKYKQIDLNDNEKEQIISFIKENKREDSNVFKPLFGGIQLLIFYLINNNAREEDSILEIIYNERDYLRINEICEIFFKVEGRELKVKHIMNVFFIFEHLCFKELCENLHNDYKEEIPEDIKTKIIYKLMTKNENDHNDKNDIFTIKELAAAVRRFISRYLAGPRIDSDPRSLLLPYLNKIDLWGEKIGKNDNLIESLSNKLEELKITVWQSFDFYQVIKEEDEKDILSYLEDDIDEIPTRRPKKKRMI